MRIAHNRIDLTGQTFGFLTVLNRAESRYESGSKRGYWKCQCKCGTIKELPTSNLTSGNTNSCGCYKHTEQFKKNNSAAHIRHGHNNYNSPTYRTWQGMRQRCRSRQGYADRGITVDPRWDDFNAFLADMGERPEGCTLDRIDNDGPYCASNCRWASPKVQGNNRSDNRMLTHDGRTQTVTQWAREFGVNQRAFYNRIFILGWDIERAKQPARQYAPRSAPADRP